jgi:hypothetical protein
VDFAISTHLYFISPYIVSFTPTTSFFTTTSKHTSAYPTNNSRLVPQHTQPENHVYHTRLLPPPSLRPTPYQHAPEARLLLPTPATHLRPRPRITTRGSRKRHHIWCGVIRALGYEQQLCGQCERLRVHGNNGWRGSFGLHGRQTEQRI